MKTTEKKVIKIESLKRRIDEEKVSKLRVVAYKQDIILLERKVDKFNISNHI